MSDHQLLAAALRATCLDHEFFGADGPCPVTLDGGDIGSGLLIVSGDTGSGKSLFLRALKAHLRRSSQDLIILAADPRTRTSSGFERMHLDANDEDGDSIAAICSTGTMKAISAARTVTQPSLLMLDEPDIGLSDVWSQAIGHEIAALAQNMPKSLEGIVVASHNRSLIECLADLKPSFLRVGTDPRPMHEWLVKGPDGRTPTIAQMKADIRARWLRIEEIMNARRLAPRAPSKAGSKTRSGRRRNAAPV